MPDIHSAYETRWKVSGTITVDLHIGKSRTHVHIGAINELIVLVLSRTTYIDTFVTSIHTAKRKTVLYDTAVVPILMLDEARSETEMKMSNTFQALGRYSAMLGTVSRCKSKSMTIGWQVVLHVMCDIPMIVSIEAVALIEEILYKSVARNHISMAARSIMDAHADCPFYSTISDFSKAVEILTQHRKFGEVVNVPQEIAYINDACFSYFSRANATECDIFVIVVDYRPAMERLEKLPDHRSVKKMEEETLRKDLPEDVVLPATFTEHSPGFLERL